MYLYYIRKTVYSIHLVYYLFDVYKYFGVQSQYLQKVI